MFRSIKYFALLALLVSSAHAAKKPVNFVVIMADDLGFADVGYHGSEQVPTPHIDSIAKRGVQFTQGYSNGYVCSPTRAALLTGRYQNRFGCDFHIAPYKANEEATIGLPLDELTIAERLKPLGYATGMFGKWHLGGELEENQKLMPASRGFDEFFGILEGASLYFDKTNRERKYRRGHAVIDGEPEYLTDAIGRESVSFIQRHKDQPFFLYVPFTAPHAPMEAKPVHMQKFAHIQPKMRRQCVSMIHSMDENIGRILQALKEAGVEENTLVVFLSDNGGKPNNNASINDPFRGAKGQFFEGGIRVPFCLQFPSTLGSGATIDTPVMSFDIFPTIYKLAGGTLDPEWNIEGQDLMPLLKEDKKSTFKRPLFWKSEGNFAVQSNGWKLMRHHGQTYLFNLNEDPSEATNKIKQNPELAQQLQKLWKKWDAHNEMPQYGYPLKQSGIHVDRVPR